MLRREGLYNSSAKQWWAQIEAGTLGTLSKRRPRAGQSPEQAPIAELERQIGRLEAASDRKDEVIADRDAALEVMGKGGRVLGGALEKKRGLSRAAWRTRQAETAQLLTALLGVVRACALVGRLRATDHWQANPQPRSYGPHPKARYPAELTAAERSAVLGVLTSAAYADLSVAQVWARELDAGRYNCSQRTMHRILAAEAMNGERRRQATHPPRTIPELVATSANDGWSWDITKMRGPTKGFWVHTYVVIDIYSRYVVGLRNETVEDGELAADLVAAAVAEQGRAPGYLHADGGGAMTSKPLASLLFDLDGTRSHNRPQTSNDNSYSESQFKTMKYTPDYPERFASIGAARAWMNRFIHWYNHQHRHSGIGMHTPSSVHDGTAETLRERRQLVLDKGYAKHPERFTRRPRPPRLPEKATINDPDARSPETSQAQPTTARLI